mgnify:CR=1 FL=1
MRNRSRWIVAILSAVLVCAGAAGSAADFLRIGVVTDVHVHDADSPVEKKVMTNYAERMTAFVDAMNAWPADIVIELGDLVNGAFVMGGAPGDMTRIAGLLDEAVTLLSPFYGPIHYVVGNHDLYNLSKDQFLSAVGKDETYYSFDLGGFHFVILDAEYNHPGEEDYDHVFMRVKCRIPRHEIEWLHSDLAGTTLPTIVCIHQPLDSSFDATAGGPPVVNNQEVRQVLSDSGVVIAVFQGHDHDNRYQQIDGIHYVTFAAMVDHTDPTSPTWAQVTLDPSAQTLIIEGTGVQADYALSFGATP